MDVRVVELFFTVLCAHSLPEHTDVADDFHFERHVRTRATSFMPASGVSSDCQEWRIHFLSRRLGQQVLSCSAKLRQSSRASLDIRLKWMITRGPHNAVLAGGSFTRTTCTRGCFTAEVHSPNSSISQIRPGFELKFFSFLVLGRCVSLYLFWLLHPSIGTSRYLQDMQQCLNCLDGQASGHPLHQTNSAPHLQSRWCHQYPPLPLPVAADSV